MSAVGTVTNNFKIACSDSCLITSKNKNAAAKTAKTTIDFNQFSLTKNKDNEDKFTGKLLFGGMAIATAIATAAVCLALRKKPVNFGSEIKKALDYSNFKNFKIFKNMSQSEKSKMYDILTYGYNQFNLFAATSLGAKPACILSTTDIPIDIMKKSCFKHSIDFIFKKPNKFINSLNQEVTSYSAYMLNRKAVMEVIRKNIDLFISRLGLPKGAKTSDIYSKVLKILENGINRNYTNPLYDIEGLILGFPKQNAMIFNLEHLSCAGAMRHQGDKSAYIEKLLGELHNPNSPYKNLSKKETIALEKAIKSIKNNPCACQGYYNSIYQFVKFVEEPDFKRVVKAANYFENNFSIMNMI